MERCRDVVDCVSKALGQRIGSVEDLELDVITIVASNIVDYDAAALVKEVFENYDVVYVDESELSRTSLRIGGSPIEGLSILIVDAFPKKYVSNDAGEERSAARVDEVVEEIRREIGSVAEALRHLSRVSTFMLRTGVYTVGNLQVVARGEWGAALKLRGFSGEMSVAEPSTYLFEPLAREVIEASRALSTARRGEVLGLETLLATMAEVSSALRRYWINDAERIAIELVDQGSALGVVGKGRGVGEVIGLVKSARLAVFSGQAYVFTHWKEVPLDQLASSCGESLAKAAERLLERVSELATDFIAASAEASRRAVGRYLSALHEPA